MTLNRNTQHLHSTVLLQVENIYILCGWVCRRGWRHLLLSQLHHLVATPFNLKMPKWCKNQRKKFSMFSLFVHLCLHLQDPGPSVWWWHWSPHARWHCKLYICKFVLLVKIMLKILWFINASLSPFRETLQLIVLKSPLLSLSWLKVKCGCFCACLFMFYFLNSVLYCSLCFLFF